MLSVNWIFNDIVGEHTHKHKHFLKTIINGVLHHIIALLLHEVRGLFKL